VSVISPANLHPLLVANIDYFEAALTWEGGAALTNFEPWAGPPGKSNNHQYYIAWARRDDASATAGNKLRGLRLIVRVEEHASTAFIDIWGIHYWGFATTSGLQPTNLTTTPGNLSLGGADCLDWKCPQLGGDGHVLNSTAMLERSRIVFSALGVWTPGVVENITIEGPLIPMHGEPPDPPWLPRTMSDAERRDVLDREIAHWATSAAYNAFWESDLAHADTSSTADHSDMGINILGVDVWAAQGNRREPSLFDNMKRFAHRSSHIVYSDGRLWSIRDPNYSQLVLKDIGPDPRSTGYKNGQNWFVAPSSSQQTHTVGPGRHEYDGYMGGDGQHWGVNGLCQAVARHQDPGLYWLVLHVAEIWQGAETVVEKGLSLGTTTLSVPRARGRRVAAATQTYQLTGDQYLLQQLKTSIDFQLADHLVNSIPIQDQTGTGNSVFMHGLWAMGMIQALQLPLDGARKAAIRALLFDIGVWVLKCWYFEISATGDVIWKCPYNAGVDGTPDVPGANSSASRLNSPIALLYLWNNRFGDLTVDEQAKLSGILGQMVWDPAGEPGQWPARSPNKLWRFLYGVAPSAPSGSGGYATPASTIVGTGSAAGPAGNLGAGAYSTAASAIAGAGVATNVATGAYGTPASTIGGVGSGVSNAGAGAYSTPPSVIAGAGVMTAVVRSSSAFKTPMSTIVGSGVVTIPGTGAYSTPASAIAGTAFSFIDPSEVNRGHYEKLTNLLRLHIAARIEQRLGLTVVYPNEAEVLPYSGLWVEAATNHTDSEAITVGGIYRFRMRGRVELTVWDDLEVGDTGVRTIAVAVRDAYQGIVASEVRYGPVTSSPVPRRGRQYGLRVSVPFTKDATDQSPVGVRAAISSGDVGVGNAIRSYFYAQITTARSIPTQFDNAPFVQPEGAKWVRLTILETTGDTFEKGSRPRYRTVGVAIVNVFVPVSSGDQEGLEIVDWVADVFRNVRVDGIRFYTPSLQTLGVGRDGQWWQLNVEMPFEHDS
jgi:hypothetical protein